jgi:hypothetical protein
VATLERQGAQRRRAEISVEQLTLHRPRAFEKSLADQLPLGISHKWISALASVP